MRLGAALLVLCAGCLSSAHYIPKNELAAIAREPPELRGRRVRVVQGFAGDEAAAESCGTCDDDVYIHGGGGGGGGGGPPRPGFRPSGAASANIDDARAFLIAAALLTVGLAATEGARYNGWVAVGPEHPVHLIGPNGEHAWLRIAELDPEAAAWARRAYVRDEDGPWRRLGRAPLDRRGLTWSMLVGSAEIGGEMGVAPGFMSHVQLGGFPTQELGLVLDLGLGWRGDGQADAVYQIRAAGEIQLLPLDAGKLHGGGYAQFGTAARSDDGAGRDRASPLWGAGGLLQLELTTYLALTGRAGVTHAFGERASDMTVGLSIY